MGLKLLAIGAALAVVTSTGAMAQYFCPPGYGYAGGVCQPLNPSYANPLSGAMTGEAAGAANGYSVAGPVGALVGGAIGIAGGTVTGTLNMVSAAACPYGYRYYNGACYP